MAIEVKRKSNERPENLINRFNRHVLQSGILRQVKKNRFYQKKLGRILRRKNALRRMRYQKKKDYLIKIGLIKPTYHK